ncbi:hypothetical protein GCM10027399_00380 [Curvibacter fontanus]|jgi:hypothetical protein
MKRILAWGALTCLLLSLPARGADGLAGEDQGIVITPKYFEPSAGSTSGGMGFSYKIRKSITSTDLAKDAYRVADLDFKADGNVAFNRNINPADFLKTGLELNYVSQSGSAVTHGGPGSKCDPTNPDTVQACEEEARRSKSGDALALIAGLMATLESDQRFEKRNETFGAHLTTLYRPAPASFANQANPLDWPFRLVRGLSGHPMGFSPSPDAFPKVRLALERVTPSKDKDRTAILGETPNYNRANIEIDMTSPVGKLQGKQVKFEWSWRYFKELGPPEAIQAAGLDQYRYSAAALSLDSGWKLTYATGKLPLGREGDAVWELGYRIKLD